MKESLTVYMMSMRKIFPFEDTKDSAITLVFDIIFDRMGIRLEVIGERLGPYSAILADISEPFSL